MIDFRKSPMMMMMMQYSAIKAANPGSLLFYRMRDFYELFFADAEIAAKTLGIALHKRCTVPMCAVPKERCEEYCRRLVAQGHRVAWCDRLENPDSPLGKRIVWRLTGPSSDLLMINSPDDVVAVDRIRAKLAEANALTERLLAMIDD